VTRALRRYTSHSTLSTVDSLDAECLLFQLAESELRAPDLWRHDRSGALSCTYVGGERVFTWPAEEVAGMARRWRESDEPLVPEPLRSLRDAHERLAALASEAELGPADAMVHDISRMELQAIWKDEKIVVVVDARREAS
jgi:hypothetical protein